ncbi:ParB/RepB/Spo0J family partition protein [Yeguia hominis]|uniref:ParB/RepB/Spo0J family partition protein n=1 Tax=Yeguia hominis TaxID=2763662 RepID=A0A926D9W9_9FIRM|nr:ParB/RepB/Spo0J family partition protein [Yeguia hominis]MBC8533994.1 ParB/RepB/Spo0J family partition protein [Yeguia hominis]
MKKRGLGKGLDAIFAENDMEDRNHSVTLQIRDIEPNRDQPRKEFSEEALQDLAESIAQHGVLQPLLVRPLLDGGYQLVAGERRWRAARIAGLTEVPAVIREMSDHEMAELALVENLQREDLTPLEEAEGYQLLIDTYGMTQEEVAKAVGKSRPAVTNALRLLGLPEEVRDMVSAGILTAGHARTLLAFENEEEIIEAAKQAAERGMTVRDLEAMAKRAAAPKKEKPRSQRSRYFEEAELALKEQLGRRVTVTGTAKKGVLQIEFYGEEDLQDLLKNFGKE